MEERHIEESVKEVIEDLKNKVETLTQSSENCDDEIAEKVILIKDKAVKVFNDASAKLSQMLDTDRNEEEIAKAVEMVKVRSKELYDNAVKRIESLQPAKEEETQPKESNHVEDAKRQIDDIISSVGDEINNFMNREDVKATVDKAKEGVVDVAEKALAILKDWLTPESEDK